MFAHSRPRRPESFAGSNVVEAVEQGGILTRDLIVRLLAIDAAARDGRRLQVCGTHEQGLTRDQQL